MDDILVSTREVARSALFVGNFELLRKIQDFDIYEIMQLASENLSNVLTLHRLGKINESNINEHILDIILTKSLVYEYKSGIEFWYKETLRNHLDSSLGLEKIAKFYPDALLNLKPTLKAEDIPNVYIDENILIELLRRTKTPFDTWLSNNEWSGVVGKYIYNPEKIKLTGDTVREMYLLDRIPNIFLERKFSEILELSDKDFFLRCLSGHEIKWIEYNQCMVSDKILPLSETAFVKLIEFGYSKLIRNYNLKELIITLIGSGKNLALDKYLSVHKDELIDISKVIGDYREYGVDIPITKSIFEILLEYMKFKEIYNVIRDFKDRYFFKKFLKRYTGSRVDIDDLLRNPMIYDLLTDREKLKLSRLEGYQEFVNLAVSKGYIPKYIPGEILQSSILESGNFELLEEIPRNIILENIQYLPAQCLEYLKFDDLDEFKVSKILNYAIKTNNVFRIKYLWSKGLLPKTIIVGDIYDNYATVLLGYLGVEIEKLK